MARNSGAKWEAMNAAVVEGNFRKVRSLVDQGADVNARNEFGETPLIWAVAGGFLEIAFLLLDEGAKVDAPDNRKATPLLWAAANGRVGMVWLLLERGADINAREDKGETALSKAAVNGQYAIVRFLVEKGAKVRKGDLRYVKNREVLDFLNSVLGKSNSNQ